MSQPTQYITEYDYWISGVPVVSVSGDNDFGLWADGIPIVSVGLESIIVDSNLYFPDFLPVPLLAHQYTNATGNQRTMMETGRYRCRRTYIDPREDIDVQWNFTVDQFADFKDFFDNTLQNGALGCSMEIMGEAKKVIFVGSTYKATHSDNLYNVSATLEYDQT